MTDTNSPAPGQPGSVPSRPEPPRLIVPKSASEALRPEAGTPPPSRRSRQSRNQFVVFLNFLFSAIVLVTLASALFVYLGKREFDEPGPLAHTDTVLIKPGTSSADIATQLEREDMISDARIFRLGLRVYGGGATLKAGEYEISPRASMRDIMELLQSGKSVQYSLTIPEGMTVEQAFQRIASTDELDGDMPAALPPEGSLATDTLKFTRGAKRQDIIDKLTADQKALVARVWDNRVEGLPLKDVNEFITLASIVEKETGRADERPRVAAVFINRLKKRMRLQSDPTIIYGLFGGKGRPADRPIYRSDIDNPTPYNTYTIDGLPPGPIANPGRAALEAVANPSQTDELYFVADGSGGHVFARTLEEHNENVARLRAFEKKQREDAEKAAAASAGGADKAQQGQTGN
jgi:UPF0755 protein